MQNYDSQLKEIIEHYGENAQVDVAVEELSELTKALMKYRRVPELAKPTAIHDILDEIADVTIMLRQLVMIYNIKEDELNKLMIYKIDRQLSRMAVDKR